MITFIIIQSMIIGILLYIVHQLIRSVNFYKDLAEDMAPQCFVSTLEDKKGYSE